MAKLVVAAGAELLCHTTVARVGWKLMFRNSDMRTDPRICNSLSLRRLLRVFSSTVLRMAVSRRMRTQVRRHDSLYGMPLLWQVLGNTKFTIKLEVDGSLQVDVINGAVSLDHWTAFLEAKDFGRRSGAFPYCNVTSTMASARSIYVMCFTVVVMF